MIEIELLLTTCAITRLQFCSLHPGVELNDDGAKYESFSILKSSVIAKPEKLVVDKVVLKSV